MKKAMILAGVLFCAALFDVSAWGAGVQGKFGLFGFDHGASLLFSPNERLHFAGDWYLADPFGLGVSADYWFLAPPTSNIGSLGAADFYYFVGIGAYAWTAIGSDDFELGAGGRLPVGVGLRLDRFEAFLQVIPQFGIGVIPSFDIGGLGVGAALGARFWVD